MTNLERQMNNLHHRITLLESFVGSANVFHWTDDHDKNGPLCAVLAQASRAIKKLEAEYCDLEWEQRNILPTRDKLASQINDMKRAMAMGLTSEHTEYVLYQMQANLERMNNGQEAVPINY